MGFRISPVTSPPNPRIPLGLPSPLPHVQVNVALLWNGGHLTMTMGHPLSIYCLFLYQASVANVYRELF